jgi:cephalosporin-C deacetylase-like acetyl esterase
MPLHRREFLSRSLAASLAGPPRAEPPARRADLHQQILALAAEQEAKRRARFAQVQTRADLAALQKSLREKFLELLDGLPTQSGLPAVRMRGNIRADDYEVQKLVFESLPGYCVPALLYRPTKLTRPVPGIISPCGHSPEGKAAPAYQILHINLAKRGYVVLTYDPVGQGERSQFWDARRGRSRFNLTCGEHCVLGNPLYLLGTSLARYRIWDGMRAIDYLTSLKDVAAGRIGCVGNSGGGTLTAYISALDQRVKVAVISCYITTLRRRMGNRVQADPDSDPEQDIFGFVSEGIDHAGLLALMAPRPTLLCTARQDFFPIEGARETFAEAARLFDVAGTPGRIKRVEADQKHGLTPALRQATYAWFQRWLPARREETGAKEIAVKVRPINELLASPDGQVNGSLKSRPLLPLALEIFKKQKRTARRKLSEMLALDLRNASFHLTEVAAQGKRNGTGVLLVNGNESADWRADRSLVPALRRAGYRVAVVDPRGVGKLKPALEVKGHSYTDPLCGVEANLAYNAFLVGRSLIGLRVADVLAAVKNIQAHKTQRVVLCGRQDAALIVSLAAVLEPKVARVAVEGMMLNWLPLFGANGRPINAAQIVPGLLRDYGDVADVLRDLSPRRVLVANPSVPLSRFGKHVKVLDKPFSKERRALLDWLRE